MKPRIARYGRCCTQNRQRTAEARFSCFGKGVALKPGYRYTQDRRANAEGATAKCHASRSADFTNGVSAPLRQPVLELIVGCYGRVVKIFVQACIFPVLHLFSPIATKGEYLLAFVTDSQSALECHLVAPASGLIGTWATGTGPLAAMCHFKRPGSWFPAACTQQTRSGIADCR